MHVISVQPNGKTEKSIAFKKWFESEAGRQSLAASARHVRKLREMRIRLARQTRKKMGNRIMK